MFSILIMFVVSKWFPFMPVKNAKGIRNDNGKECDDQDHQYEV